MKKVYYFVAITAMMVMASCQSVPGIDEASETASSSEIPNNCRSVQFVVKGLSVDYGSGSGIGITIDDSFTQENSGTFSLSGVSSKATVASEGMTDLWVWEGTTLLKHQVSTDSDFGSPTVTLTIGAHDLTFVASKSTGQSWAVATGSDGKEQGVWSCTKVADTFGAVLSYTVSGSSSSKQVSLDRCNGKVKWTIEDAIPQKAASAVISVPQCYGLDGALNGVGAGTFSNTVDLSSVRGVSGVGVSAMVLPADHAEGSTISPAITITDGDDATVCSYTNSVTLSANVVTNIHGAFFSGQGGLTISLNTEWGEQRDVSL